MVLRIPSPAWDGYGNPELAGNCTKFPAPTPKSDPWFDDMDEAMDVCNGWSGGSVCPLRTDCLRFALVNNESDGVWGGTYEHDRRRLRKKWPKVEQRARAEWEEPTEPDPEEDLLT